VTLIKARPPDFTSFFSGFPNGMTRRHRESGNGIINAKPKPLFEKNKLTRLPFYELLVMLTPRGISPRGVHLATGEYDMLKKALLVSTALAVAGLTASAAYANIPVSGSGTSGTMAPDQEWNFANGGWGSPGVSFGTIPYEGTGADTPTFGFEITFTGGATIVLGSIAIGNGAGCAGDTSGGTTFCTISPTDIWEAFQTGPSSVDFLAQNASFFLSNGQDYFVNVLLNGRGPGLPASG
jgi:hypothetical protein